MIGNMLLTTPYFLGLSAPFPRFYLFEHLHAYRLVISHEFLRQKYLTATCRATGSLSEAYVNGAQTLGSIGSLYATNPIELGKVKVLVKFISLEESPEEFGQRITIATNTQNRVEKKDFVSLDTEQGRLKIELKLENIDYHYKRTGEKVVPDGNNFMLDEVTFSLACLFDNVDYSTMVKKESGRLWEDVTKQPYTDLFNQNTSAHKIIKAVRIYRFISEKMDAMTWDAEGRERSI